MTLVNKDRRSRGFYRKFRSHDAYRTDWLDQFDCGFVDAKIRYVVLYNDFVYVLLTDRLSHKKQIPYGWHPAGRTLQSMRRLVSEGSAHLLYGSIGVYVGRQYRTPAQVIRMISDKLDQLKKTQDCLAVDAIPINDSVVDLDVDIDDWNLDDFL